jgi:dTDP-4-dehydrorhamnose reductase
MQVQRNISKKGSLYHYSNEGVTSWYDFATAIMEISNIDCKVIPIETKDYPTQARRPMYSVLDKSKIKSDFKVTIPHWRDSLTNCIKKINRNS